MSHKSRPLISIGVTTYNRPELLRECVNSILSQTYNNIEIIVANDYVPVPVTFDSLSIEPDSRVRIVNHENNIGAFENNHFLPLVASGEWFTWLADDDLMHPEFLETAWEIFSSASVKAVFSDYVADVSPEGRFPLVVPRTPPRIFGGTEFFLDYTARCFRTVGSYGIFHREIFEQFRKIKRFGTGLPVYGDTFLPLFAAALGKVAFVAQPLIFLRTHADSRSASSSQLIDYASAQCDFVSAFKLCCGPLCSHEQLQHCLSNMVRWFAADSWAVTCRGDKNVWQRINRFAKHAIGGLLPMVDAVRRPILAVGMVAMVAADSMRYLASMALKSVRRQG